jgi:hypothetical protein
VNKENVSHPNIVVEHATKADPPAKVVEMDLTNLVHPAAKQGSDALRTVEQPRAETQRAEKALVKGAVRDVLRNALGQMVAEEKAAEMVQQSVRGAVLQHAGREVTCIPFASSAVPAPLADLPRADSTDVETIFQDAISMTLRVQGHLDDPVHAPSPFARAMQCLSSLRRCW